MASIYDLSWNKSSFLEKTQLFFKSRKQEKWKMRSSNFLVQAKGYSALSSTYYTIAGTAFARLKEETKKPWFLVLPKLISWCLTWFPLGLWCYWRMLSLSNRVVELLGYEFMDASMCDVRQSILRKRGKWNEAGKCIRSALGKNLEEAHTCGLLHAGLAEVHMKKSQWKMAEYEVEKAIMFAKESESKDPRQAARIYRKCSCIATSLESFSDKAVRKLSDRAKDLAQQTGAKDQLLKAKA